MNQRPLLRGLVADDVAAIPLSAGQERAIRDYRQHLNGGEYVETPNPCVCGIEDDILVACKDRYGLPLRTVLCRHCGLMRSDPYLCPDSIVHFYRSAYRNIYEKGGVDPVACLVRMIRSGREIVRFLHTAQIEIPAQVCEIGAGTGGNLVPFLLGGHKVRGCDYGTELLRVGQELGIDLREGGFDVLDMLHAPNLVIMCHVIEHFRDPLSTMRNLREQLHPQSLVFIELPGIFSIYRGYRTPIRFLQNAHCYHFCLATLDFVMRNAGFTRICGNERIRALYRVAPMEAPQEACSDTWMAVARHLRHLVLLQRLEKRWLTRCVLSGLRGLKRFRLYEHVRRGVLGRVTRPKGALLSPE